MRMHLSMAWALVGLTTGILPGVALSQVPVPNRPETGPAVSPYINLVRRGTSAGVNYYGLVRPQIATRNAIGALQQEVDTLQDQAANPAAAPPLTTGHPVQFLNLSRYFPQGAGTTGAARTPGGQRVTTTIAPRGRSR